MRAIEVHLDLMRRLPVRTIPGKHKPPEPGVVYSDRKQGLLRDPQEKLRLARRVQRMHAAGVERFHIAEGLNLSMPTVDRYIALDISTAANAAKRRL